MLVHFAATLEYNDRKVHIIKLLKVEKEPYFIHRSASHNSWSIWGNSSRERTCLTEVTKRQEADGRTGWKEGVIPNSVNLLMCVRPRHQNSGRFFLVELRPADLTLSFTLSPSETAVFSSNCDSLGSTRAGEQALVSKASLRTSPSPKYQTVQMRLETGTSTDNYLVLMVNTCDICW